MTRIYNYYPYGTLRLDEGSTTTSFTQPNQFIGQNRDAEADLSYLNARYYSSNNGQFVSQDPVFLGIGVDTRTKQILTDPQLQNSYSYAANNSLVNKDSSGEYLETVIDLIVFALSYRDYKQNPTFLNAALAGLDGLGVVAPVPSAIGYIRYGNKAKNIASGFAASARYSGKSVTTFAGEFAKN